MLRRSNKMKHMSGVPITVSRKGSIARINQRHIYYYLEWAPWFRLDFILNINRNSWLHFPSELPERGDYNFSWHKFQEFQLFFSYARSYNPPAMTWFSGRTKLLVTPTAQSKSWIYLRIWGKIFALWHTLPGLLRPPLWALLWCGPSLLAILFTPSPDQASCALGYPLLELCL